MEDDTKLWLLEEHDDILSLLQSRQGGGVEATQSAEVVSGEVAVVDNLQVTDYNLAVLEILTLAWLGL